VKLHPNAVRIVARLIEQGRAGAKPFGVPLAVWQAEIARRAAADKIVRGNK
jgi:hypothetical protein